MKTVAVIGGGPAGATAAERLASAGLRTLLFDEKMAWEKPCGGGLTYKAYHRYPFLVENECDKRWVTSARLAASRSGAVAMTMERPLLIYSRFDLNRLLLHRAESAGAQLEQIRIHEIQRCERGWLLRTKRGAAQADYCVVATGARNPLRNAGTEWTAQDTMVALGYYVPSLQEHIDIQFLPGLEGYIWVFPRCGHLSVGICGKGEPTSVLRARLDRYMDQQGLSRSGAQFFCHVLPALARSAWGGNRVSGDGWLAVGDAAGLVDPITGEGLYYAIRSGDLASQIVLNDGHAPTAKADAYRTLLRRDFTEDLAFGSTLAKRFYLGHFLFGSVPERVVQFMRRSPRFHQLMQDIFAGTQPYLGLKERLLRNLNGTFIEVIMNFFLGRLVREEPA